MCRFLVYSGEAVLLSELITKPNNSLIRQSYKAQERAEPLNGDGFGIGWYAPEVDDTPCIFTSITPAWNNRNLSRLADKIRSPRFFAHVRAATPGLAVTELNCHPFRCGRLLWMHNGSIPEFKKIKRRLQGSLSDRGYHFIQGTTDSEHAFALFLDQLEHLPDRPQTPEGLAAALRKTIAQLDAWTTEAGIARRARYNFAVSDGVCAVVSRYASPADQLPPTLYYACGAKIVLKRGETSVIRAQPRESSVIVASEPLTQEREVDWIAVPTNHLVTVTSDRQVELETI